MSCCEKCWSDAGGNAETYAHLVELRNAYGPKCSPKEQAGQWWDEKQQQDTRVMAQHDNLVTVQSEQKSIGVKHE